MPMPFGTHSRADWSIDTLPIPWDPVRPAIYDHVLRHIEPGSDRLRDGGDTLPDEEVLFADRQLLFVPGAMDGIFSFHSPGPANDARQVAEAYDTLGRALRDPTAGNVQALYDLCCKDGLLDFLDPLIERIVRSGDTRAIPPDRLFELASLLALQAPDRGPVKFAIAMLGLFKEGGTSEVVRALGRHEEFTLFAVVAIAGQAENPDLELWELAKGVNGWGRIYCVERLAGTTNTAIKAWLLRAGFRNSVMDEYIAHLAADTGDLVDELRQEHPDDALLAGAGGMLSAMANGAPGPGMGGYAASCEAAELYLGHMAGRARTLDHLLAVIALHRYAGSGEGSEHLAGQGWSAERCAAIAAAAGRIIDRPEWRELIADGLKNEDRTTFWRARDGARRLGIDTWEASFQRACRQHGRENDWYELMLTDDPERIDRVLELAEAALAPDSMADGPGMVLYRIAGEAGEHAASEPQLDWQRHGAIDIIVQELRRFPGRGWPFVRAALGSPIVRNRNLAIRALAEWGMAAWPAEARDRLADAVAAEPDPEVKERLERLLRGEPIE
jgi:hypothetical protein